MEESTHIGLNVYTPDFFQNIQSPKAPPHCLPPPPLIELHAPAGPPQRTGGQPVLQGAPHWQLPLWQRRTEKVRVEQKNRNKNTINSTRRRNAWSSETVFKMHGETDGSAWTDMTNGRWLRYLICAFRWLLSFFHHLSWAFCQKELCQDILVNMLQPLDIPKSWSSGTFIHVLFSPL